MIAIIVTIGINSFRGKLSLLFFIIFHFFFFFSLFCKISPKIYYFYLLLSIFLHFSYFQFFHILVQFLYIDNISNITTIVNNPFNTKTIKINTTEKFLFIIIIYLNFI